MTWIPAGVEKPPKGEVVWLCWDPTEFPKRVPVNPGDYLGDYFDGRWYGIGGEKFAKDDEPSYWHECVFPSPPEIQ